MNRIEIRQPELANGTRSKLANAKLSEIFVNNEFYTAIIGTNFDPKTKRCTKYRFIHDSLNAIVQHSSSPDSLYIPLKQKLLKLDDYELYNLLYKAEESKMTTKINIEINEDNSMPVKNASYGVKVAQFEITINNTKITTPYQCPIVFNHTQIPKEQIIADIACYVIANALYCLEFNNFENPKDLQNLANELGYEETEDTTHLVSEIKVFSEALKSITLAQEDKEFIDDYINIEDSLTQATIIVNRYFNVSFTSKHYDNNRG